MHRGQAQTSRENNFDSKPKFRAFLLDQIFQKEAPVTRESNSPKRVDIKYSPKRVGPPDSGYGTIKVQKVPLNFDSSSPAKRSNKSTEKNISKNNSTKKGNSIDNEQKIKPIDLSQAKAFDSKINTDRSNSPQIHRPMTNRDKIEEQTKERVQTARTEASLERRITMNTAFKNSLRPSTRDPSEKSFIVTSPNKKTKSPEHSPTQKRPNIRQIVNSATRGKSKEIDPFSPNKASHTINGKDSPIKHGMINRIEEDEDIPCPERDKFMSIITNYLSRNIKDKHSLKFDQLKKLLLRKDLVTTVVRAPEPVLGNLKFLASYFLGITSEPSELIWLSFVFLMHRYSDKEEFTYTQEDLENSAKLMLKRAEISSKYATAFENVAQMVGIKCRIIKGYVKDFFYLPGTPLTNYEHCWNAVFLGSKWHLIDCSMAAGYFVYGPKYIRQIDLTYFMVAPDQLIITHFPETKNWQLLERVRTVEDTENLIPFTPTYKELGVVIPSCSSPYVSFTEEEHIIKVKFPNGVNVFAEISKDDLMFTMPNLIYPVMKREESLVEYHILVPDDADYFMRLFGKRNNEPHYRLLVSLKVKREKKALKRSSVSPKKKVNLMAGPFTYVKSFPKINSLLYEKYEIGLATHRYSIYHEQSEKDTLQIAIKVGKNVKLVASLFKELCSTVLDKAVFVHHKDDLYIFEIVFPESFLYKLVISVVNPENENSTSSVIEYPIFVKILSKSTKSLTFPEANFENLENYNIQLISHNYNIQHHGGSVTSPEPLTVKFKTERNMILAPRIRCVDHTVNTESLMLYTIERNAKENIHKIDLVFPKSEIYKFEIFGQTEENMDKFEPIFFLRYDLDITVNKNNMAFLSVGAVGYPRKFDPTAVIIAPMRKLLKITHEYEFRIEFPQNYEYGLLEHKENSLDMRKSGVVFHVKYKPDEEGVIAIKAKAAFGEDWHTIAEYYAFN